MAGETHPKVRRAWLQCEAVARLLSNGLGDPSVAYLLDEKVEVVVPDSLPSGGAYHGLVALEAQVAEFAATWHFEEGPLSQVSELGDDAVIVSTTGTATCRATGRPLDIDIKTIVGFSGSGGSGGSGCIVSVRSYWRDSAAALQALGVWDSWA